MGTVLAPGHIAGERWYHWGSGKKQLVHTQSVAEEPFMRGFVKV